MANEKVSQMTSLTAGELAGEDLFLVTDMSAKESKKITTAALLDYIEGTGSFVVDNAVSASYILGAGVDGIVSSASYSNNSVSSSWSAYALSALSASYSATSSVTITSVSSTTTAQTASYLSYTGFPNGTSSYARTSSVSYYADTSSVLLYVAGISKNTASYALTASSIPFNYTCSNASTASHVVTSSYSYTASFASTAVTASSLLNYSPSLTRAYAWVTWSNVVTGKYSTSANTLYKNYNISSFNYLTSIATGSKTIDYFTVTFTTPTNNVDYIFIGNIAGLNYGAYDATIGIIPASSYPVRTGGFTCSISMDTVQQPIFYGFATLTFEILGSP